ncbi:MAG: tetratricopeptide repeat protein [Spirosomataceae bacterium]
MNKWLFCIWGLSLTASAQKTEIVRKSIENMPLDTHRVSTLFELGRTYWLEGNDSLAQLYCKESVRLAKQLKFPVGEAKARLQLVRMELDYLTDLQTAYNHLDTTLSIVKKIPNKSLEGQVYFRRAQLYESFFEKQKEVTPLLNKALQLFIEAKDDIWQGTVYGEMAVLLTNEGKYAEAVDLMLKARRLQEKSNNLMALRSTIPNLGSFYVALGRFQEALQCFQEAEKIAQKLDDQRLKAYIVSQQAEIFEKQGKYKEALGHFLQAAKIHEISQATQWLPRIYARIGGVYLSLKEYDKALQYTQTADSLYKSQVDSKEALEHVSQINFGKLFLIQKKYKQVISYASKGLEWANEAEPPLRREAAEYHRQLSKLMKSWENHTGIVSL